MGFNVKTVKITSEPKVERVTTRVLTLYFHYFFILSLDVKFYMGSVVKILKNVFKYSANTLHLNVFK